MIHWFVFGGFLPQLEGKLHEGRAHVYSCLPIPCCIFCARALAGCVVMAAGAEQTLLQ